MEQFPNFYEQTGTGPSERLSAETPRVLGWCHSRSCFSELFVGFQGRAVWLGDIFDLSVKIYCASPASLMHMCAHLSGAAAGT